MRKLVFLGLLSCLSLTLFPITVQAGSGGAVGGNDSGSNLDSSTITGGTFNLLDSRSVENPLGATLRLECVPDERGIIDENCIPSESPAELTRKIKDNLASAEVNLLAESSLQFPLFDQLIDNLGELEQMERISATQFEQTLQLYNSVVNALTPEQVVAVSQMEEAQRLKTVLLSIRGLFYETTTQNR